MLKINCIDKKTFELVDGSEMLGHVIYDGFFSFTANAIIGTDNYKITQRGIFSSTISVTRSDQLVASMKMNWKGHMIISFQNEQEFTLKTTGTFANKFVLASADQQKIMVLDPGFSWAKFSYNYSITCEKKPSDALLILLAGYAANYCMAAMSSALY